MTPDHLDVFPSIWVLSSYGSFWTFSLTSTNVWGTGRDDADKNRVDTHFALWTVLLKLTAVTAHIDNRNIFKAQSGKLECMWSKRPGESGPPPGCSKRGREQLCGHMCTTVQHRVLWLGSSVLKLISTGD